MFISFLSLDIDQQYVGILSNIEVLWQMGALHQSGKLQCPYAMCSRTFEKPIVLTDKTRLVRETYYACPHCRSKIEIIVEDPNNPRLIQVDGMFNTSQKAPPQCKHGFGHLGEMSENADIPDECAVCPRVMQCYVRRRAQ